MLYFTVTPSLENRDLDVPVRLLTYIDYRKRGNSISFKSNPKAFALPALSIDPSEGRPAAKKSRRQSFQTQA